MLIIPKYKILDKDLSDKKLIHEILNKLDLLNAKDSIYAFSHITFDCIMNSAKDYDFVSFKIPREVK